MRNTNVKRQAELILAMDKVIRMTNDEDNGIFYSWVMDCVPDGATQEELEDFLTDDSQYYDECLEFFAHAVTTLMIDGDWNKDGWCLEFYNPEAKKKAEGKEQENHGEVLVHNEKHTDDR